MGCAYGVAMCAGGLWGVTIFDILNWEVECSSEFGAFMFSMGDSLSVAKMQMISAIDQSLDPACPVIDGFASSSCAFPINGHPTFEDGAMNVCCHAGICSIAMVAPGNLGALFTIGGGTFTTFVAEFESDVNLCELETCLSEGDRCDDIEQIICKDGYTNKWLNATRANQYCNYRPTESPSKFPTKSPSKFPTKSPSNSPSKLPTTLPVTQTQTVVFDGNYTDLQKLAADQGISIEEAAVQIIREALQKLGVDLANIDIKVTKTFAGSIGIEFTMTGDESIIDEAANVFQDAIDNNIPISVAGLTLTPLSVKIETFATTTITTTTTISTSTGTPSKSPNYKTRAPSSDHDNNSDDSSDDSEDIFAAGSVQSHLAKTFGIDSSYISGLRAKHSYGQTDLDRIVSINGEPMTLREYISNYGQLSDKMKHLLAAKSGKRYENIPNDNANDIMEMINDDVNINKHKQNDETNRTKTVKISFTHYAFLSMFAIFGIIISVANIFYWWGKKNKI